MGPIIDFLTRVAERRPRPTVAGSPRWARRLASVAALSALAPALGGCQIALFDPAGPIGAQEKSIILLATGLMLIVVVPVILMTLAFAWRYRASNTRATYAPDWEHSNRIEAVVWLVPCIIIAILGSVTWVSSHTLDPYRPIETGAKPVDVDVVSLDWKWLFIYPDQKVASVNQLVIPTGAPVRFHLTSASVMNAFFIPRLGTQIYTMPGMETKLTLVASKPGEFAGMSANYSGGGFSDMTFTTKALDRAGFDRWVESARASQGKLDMAAYRQLAQPGVRKTAETFGAVEPTLYHDILNKCSDGSQCTDMTMKVAMLKNALGGLISLCNPSKAKGI
jgi:cytochrome o ubiquinol oxidase subunit II